MSVVGGPFDSGHPTDLASLRPAEVVVDLGCSGGLDMFLAAKSEDNTCGDDQIHDGLSHLLRRYDVNGFAASVKVFAVKPR